MLDPELPEDEGGKAWQESRRTSPKQSSFFPFMLHPQDRSTAPATPEDQKAPFKLSPRNACNAWPGLADFMCGGVQHTPTRKPGKRST